MMSAPPNTRAQLLLALSQQNWDQLDELMDDLADAMGEDEAREYLRNSVLPQSSITAVEAFWRHVMDADQFSELMEHMAMATTHRLESEGYQLGVDFSYTVRADGLRQLLLNEDCRQAVRRLYPAPRYSTLRILMA